MEKFYISVQKDKDMPPEATLPIEGTREDAKKKAQEILAKHLETSPDAVVYINDIPLADFLKS